MPIFRRSPWDAGSISWDSRDTCFDAPVFGEVCNVFLALSAFSFSTDCNAPIRASTSSRFVTVVDGFSGSLSDSRLITSNSTAFDFDAAPHLVRSDVSIEVDDDAAFLIDVFFAFRSVEVFGLNNLAIVEGRRATAQVVEPPTVVDP